MTKCIVKNCHSNSGTDSGVTLHGFPSSLDLIKLWLQQTGNTFSDIDAIARNVLYSRSGRYQICSKHFSPKSYIFNGTKMVLKPDAVPTVFQEVQSVSKVLSCQKVREETDTRLHSAPSKAHVENQTPLPRHKPRNVHTDEQEHSGFMEAKQYSTDTMKMIDKAVGTDPFYDIIESKIEKMLNKRLLNIAMEIITLLAGEEYMMVKKDSSASKSTLKKEVPVKCGDISISFSMDEWDYIEDHRHLYEEMMEDNDQHPSSGPPPDEPELCNEPVNQVSITDSDDVQSRENIKQEGVSINIFMGESNTIPSDQEIEEPCVINSMEAIVGEEETCADDFRSSDLGEEPYIMTCSPGEIVEDDQTVVHDSQTEGEEEPSPSESPMPAIENPAYSSTSIPQCEEQAWSDYERYVGDPSYSSGEPVQIKEENNQLNYSYGEEPAFVDPNPTNKECSELFDTMNNLLIHQITFGQSSSVDKPYACNHCEKRFAKRSHLGMHLKTHTGERPYACPDCGKKFSRRSNMLTHYRTHTGEKPFACPKCGKRFTQSSHMVTHQRTHSSDKLFTCPECKKCFTKWSYLNFHLRTHGIEKLSVP